MYLHSVKLNSKRQRHRTQRSYWYIRNVCPLGTYSRCCSIRHTDHSTLFKHEGFELVTVLASNGELIYEINVGLLYSSQLLNFQKFLFTTAILFIKVHLYFNHLSPFFPPPPPSRGWCTCIWLGSTFALVNVVFRIRRLHNRF